MRVEAVMWPRETAKETSSLAYGLYQGNTGISGKPCTDRSEQEVEAAFHYYGMFQKQLYNDIPEVTMWRALRKRLHLKAYKLFVVQGVERWIVSTPLN
jgi:hypothetical protein